MWNFALYEHNNLLAVTMYKRGAEAVQRALEARDTVIAEQAARIEQLMAAARSSGPEHSIPAPTRYRDRVRHGQEEQLGFFSGEQKERFTAERRAPVGAAPECIVRHNFRLMDLPRLMDSPSG
jgi:hypothetical protein